MRLDARQRDVDLSARAAGSWPGSGGAGRPAGPTVLENHDRAAPAATYEDMIRTSHDEVLFDYYFSSQLATIDTTTGRRTMVGQPAIFDAVTPSPDDRFILVSRLTRPFSHLLPIDGFPQQVEIWNRRGEVARTVAQIPSHEGVTLTGVRTGPRDYRWRPDQPATLIWVEALDGGDLKNQVPFRDKLCRGRSPVHGRARGICEDRVPLSEPFVYGEGHRAGCRIRSGDAPRPHLDSGAGRRAAETMGPRGEDRLCRSRHSAHSAGSAARRSRGGGGRWLARPVRSCSAAIDIYLAGEGASPEGDRPFLDRLNLKTLASERLLRSDSKSYETPIAPLDRRGHKCADAFGVAHRAAELLHSCARNQRIQAGGHGIQRSAGILPRRPAAVHYVCPQGRGEAVGDACICLRATRKVNGFRSSCGPIRESSPTPIPRARWSDRPIGSRW